MESETLLEGEELKAPRKLAAIQQGKDIYGINDMELAFATYVVYTMSRDGMGKVFSESKYRTVSQAGGKSVCLCRAVGGNRGPTDRCLYVFS